MNRKSEADGTLSTMTDGLRFQGGIVSPLTLIKRLKKLLFEFEIFYQHRVRIEKDA